MTIGPASSGVPATGDKVVLPGGEAAGVADMFGGIIADMAAALGAEAVKGEGAVAPGTEAEASTVEPSAAASVAQLLALTVRQQGKARLEAEGGEPANEGEADCELALLLQGDDVPEAVPVAQPMVSNADQQMPAAKTGKVAETPAPVAPQAPAAKADIKVKVAELAKALIAKPDAEQVAPKTVAAAQIADLLKAVTKPIAFTGGRHAASERTARTDESAPVAAPEVRGLVHAALTAAAPSAVSALDGARALETSLEPLPAEPALDSADFAIERQLDVSAEGEWLDSLAKDIARTAGEGGTLRFKLNPENLGSLRVEITPQANGSVVRLTADTDAARTIIADAQPRLVAEARANGVRISETHVDLGGQHSSGDPRRQNAAQEEVPVRTARFLRDREESDGKPTRSQSERYA